ncbi:Gfo/Idh/MocA family oxidoreductase [Rahnella sp. C60]|uniref:Gfo/Idh/MocA family protein n=1 Tax=Rahnella TaxID=34037 RepID=UPI0010211423|nr:MULTISPECIES: Gfo/Idh/MocA family oxidoreductase [Rahnella]MBU9811998.1 Gfo/Idh/MocA family oxidoreductase [Rahnella perminowiae]MBU9817723.1 Gfo/Idh/MocA family oxidoreductase [Rahnella perminowiae]MBU9828194.1 Gfo/Idh/MocA family oxidoreductase [Rahnella perminowiae]MCR9001535.1 Gfo/Idh/MocA family oxidoreductase [Rahnella perminowiae]MCX2944545.1 Gfo/Idh/MocA family oxidoreductase [Rahnella perminowiae]
MKVGIVGLGFRMSNVVNEFHKVDPEFSIAGYVDPAPAGLPNLHTFGIKPGDAYSSLDDLLKNADFDLLMVGSPNYLHLEHVRAGLEAGKRVFTEKPVVINEEQTLAMAALIRQYGSDNIIVGLVLRYSPLFIDLMHARQQGLLGEIASIEATEHIRPFHGAFFQRDWRRYEKYAGPYILEKCCHDIDLYQGLMGERPVRVASFGGRKSFTPDQEPRGDFNASAGLYHSKPSGWSGTDAVFTSDADIIDYQTALIEYSGGATLAFHANLNVPDEFRRFCVIGSQGMAEGDFVRNFFRVHDARSGDKVISTEYEGNAYDGHYGADALMAEHVVKHLKTGSPLNVSVVDALEAGLTAIKIDEARKKRSVIDLTESWQRFDQELGRVSSS